MTEQPVRQRCYTCFRPVSRCFCESIPQIDNSTEVVILQHVKERFHAFNSARIVRAALQRCELFVDQMEGLASRELPAATRPAVLYPSDDAIALEDLPEHDRPDQLVVLDGTWHHAKKLIRLPALRGLPRVRLNPAEPSTYRIRLEPAPFALSTLEATAACLRVLEPETLGIDGLLNAFNKMIDGQLAHPQQEGRLRKRSGTWRPRANIPSVLLEEPERIVVCYAEVLRGARGVRPVVWMARRLTGGPVFYRTLDCGAGLTPELLAFFELSENDFDSAVSSEQFAAAWQAFLQPDDVLTAFNSGTLKSQDDAENRRRLILKSINLGSGRSSLADLLSEHQVSLPAAVGPGRAGQRLANALAWAEHLRSMSVN